MGRHGHDDERNQVFAGTGAIIPNFVNSLRMDDVYGTF